MLRATTRQDPGADVPPGGELMGLAANGTPHLPSVKSAAGERWLDHRRTLTPRFSTVWRDVFLCFAAMAVAITVVVTVEHRDLGAPWAAPVAVLAAAWTGYWLHALFLFGHEAAHTNLARTRRWNDRLADWTVWLLFGLTTKSYRRTHMAHHGHLGDHEDSETSYHLCMSVVNVLKAATGVRVLEVLLRRRRNSTERRRAEDLTRPVTATSTRRRRTASGVVASLRSAAAHAAVVGGLWSGGAPVAVLTWVVAVACVFPLLATVRTIVEHRRVDAACAVDFTVEVHGAVNRLFGTGMVARYFGAAGFNRHLLHHWDPAISYTRFDEMERFFLDTPLAAVMDASRSGYAAQIRRLMAEARRG